MKRIISACLEQTIHFQLKDGVEKSIAARNAKEDYETYKNKWKDAILNIK